jgi:hypothetical protein
VSRRPANGIRGVALLSLLSSACWGYPIIDVSVTRTQQGALRFRFERCSGLRKLAHVERLAIRAESGGDSPSVLCGLVVPEGGRPLALSEWTYGQPVKGFVRVGPCTPLVPGTYRIDVVGSGAGSRTTAVGADGRLDEKTPRCGL